MKYKNLTIENIPEPGSKSRQLFDLCINQCDWENGWINGMIYGSNIAVFSLSYLVDHGFYDNVADASKNAGEDFRPLMDVFVNWNKKGQSVRYPLFTGIHRINDLIVVCFVPAPKDDYYCADLSFEELQAVNDMEDEVSAEFADLYKLMLRGFMG